MTHSISAPRTAWLLMRLRLRRQLNQIEAIWRFHAGSAGRKATSRASPTRMILGALVALAMLGGFTGFAYQCIANMQAVLGFVQVRGDPGAAAADRRPQARPKLLLRRIAPEPDSLLARGVIQAATLATTLLFLVALFGAIANRELARPEWDLEWLVTLPLPLSTLVASRVVERVVINYAGFLVLAPFLSVLAWTCGYRWTAPLLGSGFTLVFLLLLATVQVLFDTGLRLALPPSQLRNLQATIALVGLVPLFPVLSMALPDSFALGWAVAMPDAMKWLPTGLAVRAIAAADAGAMARWSAVMVAEILVLVAIGVALLQWQMRNGVVAAGLREAVVRRSPAWRAARSTAVHRQFLARMLSPVQRRELRLLGRDRVFMVQTLLLPTIIAGMQIVLNLQTNIFVGAMDHPSNLAAIAFVLVAYTLAFSAFQTLNAEGQALWIIYCVPHSLESVLRQKACLWAVVATIYPLIVFAIAIVMAGGVSFPFIGCAVVVLAGVPIFAVIATALGVFACDPLAPDVHRRVSVTHFYLYMLLASLYAYALYASDVWQRLALMILTALLAIALWQKARDRFDYLLDPTAWPPPRVSVSDGLIAALLFFVLQAIVMLVQITLRRAPTGNMTWIAFCVAGALTYGAMRFIYWRGRFADVPRLFGHGVGRALPWAIAGGIAAAFAGLAYIKIVLTFDLFPAARGANEVATMPVWLAVTAIVAAPIFEEFIFRGLIFRGLQRSFGVPLAAIASAAVFAIVHPPMSVIPVFCLGLMAAAVYHRAGMLVAPILVHAIYNAAALGLYWNTTWLQ